MKYLIIGDQHVADRAPSSRKDTYRQDILDKLVWIIEEANRQEVDAVLNLGDVFHIKRPDRNSHALVNEVAEIFGGSNAPVIICPGNHDLQMDRLDSIPSQPLGTLGLHPNVEILMGASNNFPVYSVPYVDPTEENLRFWTDKYRSEDGPSTHPFVLTHQAIFPAKEEPIYPYVSAEDWASEFGAAYTAYGHIHSRMKAGPFYEIGGTTFCNNGAISRGSLHEETINRKLAVTLFDDSEQEGKKAFTSVPIPYKPADEVFDLESVAIAKGNDAKIDAFLGSLKSSELKHLTIETVLDSARSNPNLGKEAVLELEDIVTQVMTN